MGGHFRTFVFHFNFNHLWSIIGQLIHVNRNQDLTYMAVYPQCCSNAWPMPAEHG